MKRKTKEKELPTWRHERYAYVSDYLALGPRLYLRYDEEKAILNVGGVHLDYDALTWLLWLLREAHYLMHQKK